MLYQTTQYLTSLRACFLLSSHPFPCYLWYHWCTEKREEDLLSNVGGSHIPVSLPHHSHWETHTNALSHVTQSRAQTKSHTVWLIHTRAYAKHTHAHNVSHSHRHISHTRPNLSQNINSSVSLRLGGPGSGKGTQSLKIAERYGFQYVSVGELLRKKMIHNATSNRKWSLIAKIITNGELAPQVAEQQRRRVEHRGEGGEMRRRMSTECVQSLAGHYLSVHVTRA